ncbi:lysozyme [Yersinia pseudotuberculosis]|uniref:Lysozyme n=1 Tax=Yersinia pseudotuberculosis serotype O:1b (strain IP 31758) TaxID=349747 RepID=A0A0U1QVW9_YERP3|nr:conserved hypothetical protein [Yersinia pseudotuberculosis IP 31758]AJK15018.1 hypothetical protein BZ19_1191 [Yersinia pseudotuberculosis str. PA3606]UFA61911.1 Endolysin R21-like protein [Yersinia pseudotuberculosis]CNH87944.1 lysozyme [Yersinia pseudotuberculosis]CNI02084.1 lysozyme [Yersinia pseudotuberculosis]
MASTKTKISAAVLGLVIAGVPASIILSQFLDEKEGNRLTAYLDGKNIWTICRGVTRVDGKPVMKGMRLTAEKCSEVNKLEADNALAWVITFNPPPVYEFAVYLSDNYPSNEELEQIANLRQEMRDEGVDEDKLPISL